METGNKIIMPLYFAAPISWYERAITATEIVLVNDFRFPKQTLRHKLQFAGVEGRQDFSIPLVKDSRGKDYKSVEISYMEHWQNQLVHALKTAYGKSPYFEYYGYRFEEVILAGKVHLWELNLEMLKATLRCLRLEIPLMETEDHDKLPEPEFISAVKSYYQVFANGNGFIPGLSILDLLFNEGPDAYGILKNHTFA